MGPVRRRAPVSFALLALLVPAPLALAPGSAHASWLETRLNQDTTTELQNEEQIAVNPQNPDNLVAVWRDFRLGYRQIGWGYTMDGGATWTEGGLMVESQYPYQSDPGITTDAAGNFYAVILSFTDESHPNGLFVYRSTDGGVSWEAPHAAVNGTVGVFEDKEFLACDRTGGTHDGNLYVTWTRFGFSTRIVFVRSTDGGVTWSSPLTVSDGSSVQFPIPVVGKNGNVYVAWTSYATSAIRLDVSTNGGAGFGTDRTVKSVATPADVINGGIDVYSSPAMDADLTDGTYAGRLYIAYMDQRSGYADYDIWVTHSDDAGVTWSTPLRVNDDTASNGRDQFHPWLTVDNSGTVSIVFLDRRDDPLNRSYYCYLAQSSDGGATWTNERVSSVPSDPLFARDGAPGEVGVVASRSLPTMSINAGLIGEYIGVAAWNGRATPVWTDIRNHNQDVFAGHLVTTGVPPVATRSGSLRLLAQPNPARRGQAVTVSLAGAASPGGATPLRVYDAAGRLVRELAPAVAGASSASVVWDGRDGARHAVPSGVYFLRAGEGGASVETKLLVVE